MKKLIYFGIKEEAKDLRIINRNILNKELSLLSPGRYDVIIQKHRKNKSNPQLGYLFGCVYQYVLKGLNDVGYEFTSIDQIDAYMKQMFAGAEMINRHTGEIINIPGLKRDFTTTEMMSFIEAIRTWAAEFLNLYIPSPEENAKINFD